MAEAGPKEMQAYYGAAPQPPAPLPDAPPPTQEQADALEAVVVPAVPDEEKAAILSRINDELRRIGEPELADAAASTIVSPGQNDSHHAVPI